jgi:hypothetical protein
MSAGVYVRRRSEPARGRAAFFLNRSPSRRRNSQTALWDTLTPRAASSSLRGMQRQMRRLANPFSDEGAMQLKHRLTVAAHLAGRYRAGRAMTLRPLHN